ncbi:hypothetical protein BH20CHL6_BH20CHL6_16770 [soil metagenome]
MVEERAADTIAQLDELTLELISELAAEADAEVVLRQARGLGDTARAERDFLDAEVPEGALGEPAQASIEGYRAALERLETLAAEVVDGYPDIREDLFLELNDAIGTVIDLQGELEDLG